MASALATPAIIAAIRTLLVADATLTALLHAAPDDGGPGIYAENSVPPGADFDYITIGASTEVPFNTMGPASSLKWGSNLTVQVKALSTVPNDDQVYAIISRAKALLDGAILSVAGYGSARAEFDSAAPVFTEAFAGGTVRHYPMIVRVYAHQAAA